MEIQEKKMELISRISNIENTSILDEIEKIVDESETPDFDFEKAFPKGYTVAEFREEISKRRKAYPWKK